MRLMVAVLATGLAIPAAPAATLRAFGTLSGPTVAVSDLWDDSGAVATTVLGPAPAPGERIIVEAPQLAAIARQFGVDWRPDSAAARSILERPGVLLPQAEVTQALRAWLAEAGAPTGTLDLADWTAPLVAPEAASAVTVEHCTWDAASGRFSAVIAVAGRGMPALRLPVAGRIVAVIPAMVATRRLPAGAVLAAADVAPGEVPRERLHEAAATEAAQAVGLRLRRAVAEGDPVLLADLAPPPVIARGGRVAIAIDLAGVALTAIGESLQAGAIGERIAVRNPSSRAVLLAEVTGPGTVRVDPGSLPLRPAVVGAPP